MDEFNCVRSGMLLKEQVVRNSCDSSSRRKHLGHEMVSMKTLCNAVKAVRIL